MKKLFVILFLLSSRTLFADGDFIDSFVLPGLSERGWTVSDAQDDNVIFVSTGKTLKVIVQTGEHALEKGINFGAARLWVNSPGQFVAETKFQIDPLFAIQGAGLLYFQDENNYIKLFRVQRDGSKQKIVIEGVIDGKKTFPQWIDFSDKSLILRMTYSGGECIGWSSLDGSEWVRVGDFYTGFSGDTTIGIFVENQWQDNPLEAEFDYFKVYQK
ncbi:MAG: hypothetical protein A2Y33_11360 [Spirochaetes bacterium GWF1_51_8]|nr:MAG: hypothetical protein A2Y33_11360 [Spirochaetes bacterium GWF1_51_8]